MLSERGGAGSHLWNVHLCQRNTHSPAVREQHFFPQHHPQKVKCVSASEWTHGSLCDLDECYDPVSSSFRSQSCESEYLSAGSRLLSAACIPQPKLTVHSTPVNASQEQVFTLDILSARRWLSHNHLWASEVWMQWTKSLSSACTFYFFKAAYVYKHQLKLGIQCKW